MLAALNFLAFVALPLPLSANRLAARDNILQCRLDAIRNNFDPGTTFIISVYDYQHAAYYLPEFTSQRVDTAVAPQVTYDLPAGTRQVVIFEEFLNPADPADTDSIEICRDQRLYYMAVGDHRQIAVDWDKRIVSLNGSP